MPWFSRRPPSLPDRICPTCGTANPPTARFCHQCATPLAANAPPSSAPTDAAPAVLAPVPSSPSPIVNAGQVANTHTEGGEERRVVTVLFADLVNSTTLAEELDPEEWRGFLTRYFQTMEEQIMTHGGIVEKFIGDAVMGIFGLPRAHEDDPVRAIRAALDMQAAIAALHADLDPQFPTVRMRIGINTGTVIASADDERRDFLVTGDPVNVAARLQQIAEPGAIVVGPRTFRDVQGAIAYRALPAAELKGKARPIRAWEVLGMRDANPVPLARARTLEAPRTAFIGREAELRLLLDIYARVRQDHRPHLVTILGAPGIGKTRLAREFLNRIAESVPEPEILIGRAALYGEGITYWPLTEMLRDFCDIAPTTPPEEARALLLSAVRLALNEAGRPEDPIAIARAIGTTIGLETIDRAEHVPEAAQRAPEATHQSWRVFFEAIAAMGPLVILVDDIHWADDALLDLLKNIINPASGAPILLICTARPELLQRHHEWGAMQRDQLNLALDPLTSPQSTQLIADIVGGTGLPSALRDDILRRGEGNPFFIEEILRMLIDRGILSQRDGQWHVSGIRPGEDDVDLAIPDTVQGVLAARLDLLAPPEREVLRHAAIIGRTFWPGAILGMAPQFTRPELELVLDDLVAKDLIVPATQTTPSDVPTSPEEPRYLFKHVLTRDVVYDTMSRARRAQEHQHFAEWLEQFAVGHTEAYAELLARHFEEYYRQSGLARSRDIAARRVVLEKVIEYLEEAGDGAIERQAPQAAIRYFSRAQTLLEEDGEDPSPERRHMWIVLYARRGDARALLSDGDGAWRDYRTALQWWRQSADTPTTTEMQPERTIGMRLYRRLVTLPMRYPSWFHQEPPIDEIQGYLIAGLQLADESGERESLDRVTLLTAKTFFWWSWPQGRGQAQILEALASAEEAVRIAERLDAPREASIALDALGSMEATITDLRGHLASQARRLYWARRIDDPTEIFDIHCEVSSAHQMVGEYPRAIDHAMVALDLADRLENDVLRIQALHRLVIAQFEWEHFAEAIAHGTTMHTIAARSGIARQNHYRWAMLALVIALWRTDQYEQAERLLREVADWPAIFESQYVAVFRARVPLAQARWQEAEALLRAALEVRAGRHSQPMLLAELAELGVRLDRPDLMDEFVRRAVNLGERSGARKPLAQAVRARGAAALRGGHLNDARRDLTTALNQFEALGTIWEAGRTHYLLAELARQNPNVATEQQRQELRRAADCFAQVGARHDAQRAQTDLERGTIRLF